MGTEPTKRPRDPTVRRRYWPLFRRRVGRRKLLCTPRRTRRDYACSGRNAAASIPSAAPDAASVNVRFAVIGAVAIIFCRFLHRTLTSPEGMRSGCLRFIYFLPTLPAAVEEQPLGWETAIRILL